MTFSFLDFLIGFFLMNAMPHLIFGQTKTQFVSLFGFSANANLAYATFNTIAALTLFHFQYGISNLFSHGLFLGSGFILLCYNLTGKFFYNQFHQ